MLKAYNNNLDPYVYAASIITPGLGDDYYWSIRWLECAVTLNFINCWKLRSMNLDLWMNS